MFVKLTRVQAVKRSYYIRADAIISIGANSDGNSTITTSNEFSFSVVETPEEVIDLINRASQNVKN